MAEAEYLQVASANGTGIGRYTERQDQDRARPLAASMGTARQLHAARSRHTRPMYLDHLQQHMDTARSKVKYKC